MCIGEERRERGGGEREIEREKERERQIEREKLNLILVLPNEIQYNTPSNQAQSGCHKNFLKSSFPLLLSNTIKYGSNK